MTHRAELTDGTHVCSFMGDVPRVGEHFEYAADNYIVLSVHWRRQSDTKVEATIKLQRR